MTSGLSAESRASVLRDSQFRILLIARTTSFFGDSLTPIAMPFAVLSIGGGATDIGLVLGAGTAASLLFLLVGGVVADRLPRRLLLVSSDLVQGVVVSVMAFLLLSGHCAVWHLVALQTVYGLAMALSMPAFNGILPEIVDAARLKPANGLLSMGESAAEVSGPVLAGVLVAFGSPGLALTIDAITFFVSSALLQLLRATPRISPAEPTSFTRDLRAGWQEVLKRRWYWVSLLTHSACNFGVAIFFVLGPIIVSQQLGGPTSWGFVATAAAVGSMMGGFVLLRIYIPRPLVTGNVAVALFAPGILLLIGPADLAFVLVAAAAGAFGIALLNGTWNSTVQQFVPTAILSRLSSFDMLISIATMPLAYMLVGPLIDAIGTTNLLMVAALGLVAPALLSSLEPTIRTLRADRDGVVQQAASTPVEDRGPSPG